MILKPTVWIQWRKNKISPPFYFRYVDDVCMCVDENDVNSIFEVINSYNQHLKFTCECEMNEKLNFLDITLQRNKDGNIITNWYQKPTSTDRFLNFHSNHTIQQKKIIAYNLIDRAI